MPISRTRQRLHVHTCCSPGFHIPVPRKRKRKPKRGGVVSVYNKTSRFLITTLVILELDAIRGGFDFLGGSGGTTVGCISCPDSGWSPRRTPFDNQS